MDNNILRNIAQGEKYYLQLNPYSMIYKLMLKEKKKNKGRPLSITEVDLVFSKYFQTNLQIHEIDLRKRYNMAAYMSYERNKSKKFRKYTIKDEFHACKEDFKYEDNIYQCKCDNSEFRNIDKCRLIYRAIENTIDLESLRQYKLFDNIYILRNYEAYKSRFTFE